MKRIFAMLALASVAVLSVSCQKEDAEPYAYATDYVFEAAGGIVVTHIHTNVPEPLFELSELPKGYTLLNYSHSGDQYNLRFEIPSNPELYKSLGNVYVKDAHLKEDSTVWLPVELFQKGLGD